MVTTPNAEYVWVDPYWRTDREGDCRVCHLSTDWTDHIGPICPLCQEIPPNDLWECRGCGRGPHNADRHAAGCWYAQRAGARIDSYGAES